VYDPPLGHNHLCVIDVELDPSVRRTSGYGRVELSFLGESCSRDPALQVAVAPKQRSGPEPAVGGSLNGLERCAFCDTPSSMSSATDRRPWRGRVVGGRRSAAPVSRTVEA
jgi:hypothetical protein